MPSRASRPNKDTPIVSDGRLREGENEGIEVGSATWFDWLRDHDRFYIECDAGSFTARKENRRRKEKVTERKFWTAYRSVKGHLYNAYLGQAQQLSLDKLWEAAYGLSEKIHPERSALTESPQVSGRDNPAQARNLMPGALAVLKAGYNAAWKKAYGRKSPFKDGETVIVHHSLASRNGNHSIYIIRKTDDPRRFGAAPESQLLSAAALLEQELAQPLQERDVPRQTLEWIHILEPEERETLVRGARHLVKVGGAANLEFANLEAYGDGQVMKDAHWRVIQTLVRRSFLAPVADPTGKHRQMITPLGVLAARLYAGSPLKALKVRLYLSIERNNSFVRGKKSAKESVELLILPHYDRNYERSDNGDYLLTILYQSDEELDERMYELLDEIASTADIHNCFSESGVSAMDGSYRHW